MTKQEIQALINAKIAGQGNQIDLGGALPSILTALNELAGNAVSPDKTDMTEQEQMKVRKNLGLYYEEGTTVYKIPDKYLGNALLTVAQNLTAEQIAQVKTNLQISDGGMPVATLKQVPQESQYYISDISDYLSAEDIDKLLAFETCIAVSGAENYFVYVKKETDMMGNTRYWLFFFNSQGHKFDFYFDGASTYNIEISEPESDLINLTSLPTASMTQQEFEEIGLNSSAFRGACTGAKKGFNVSNGAYYPVFVAELVSGNDYTIEFYTLTDKYILVQNITSRQISCTVTPR